MKMSSGYIKHEKLIPVGIFKKHLEENNVYLLEQYAVLDISEMYVIRFLNQLNSELQGLPTRVTIICISPKILPSVIK